MTGRPGDVHAFASATDDGPLCGDAAAVHISTARPTCAACLAVLEAAAAAKPELQLLVVLNMADDDRTPRQVCEALRHALEAGRATGYLEHVLYIDDIPAGTRILAPGERNGRA